MIGLDFVGWSMVCVYMLACFISCVSLCNHIVKSEDKPKCIGSLLVIFISLLMATRKCSLDVGLILNTVIPALLLLVLYVADGVGNDRH